MQYVLVIDRNRKPLMPCHPARARELLRKGKAAILRHYPFTIVLKNRDGGDLQPVTFKVDPGSRMTGIVLVADSQSGKRVIWAAVLKHRGEQIKQALLSRKQLRRTRRSRCTRYRQARFDNRRKSINWLPPSLMSRVNNIWTWWSRLNRFAPIASIVQELVKFDTQSMQNAEISGIEYQQGTLAGYEVREYLLEKWGRQCAYCGKKEVPLAVEHIVPRSRGGGDRVSNLTLACHECNQRKGTRTAAEFGYPNLQKQVRSLKDAAAINATRWALWRQLQTTGLAVEIGTGALTKFNRSRQGYQKQHWVDAACVGISGEHVAIASAHVPILIHATGHGRRQRCRPDTYGFPKAYAPRAKSFAGFQTGDIVKAVVPRGKFKGKHIGRISIRFRPSFWLCGFDVHPKYLVILQQADGYEYWKGEIDKFAFA